MGALWRIIQLFLLRTPLANVATEMPSAGLEFGVWCILSQKHPVLHGHTLELVWGILGTNKNTQLPWLSLSGKFKNWCHFGIGSGQRFFHHRGLEKWWGAVRHVIRCGISLRIFLEGSRGSIPSQEIHFSQHICFNMFNLEVKYEHRPERSSQRAATAVLHKKTLQIQWNRSQTPPKM